jgi:hypothetical protein
MCLRSLLFSKGRWLCWRHPQQGVRNAARIHQNPVAMSQQEVKSICKENRAMYYPPEQFMSGFGLPSQQPPIPMVVYFRRSRMIFTALIFVGLLALFGTLFWFLSHPSPLPVVFYACVGIVLLYELPLMVSIFRALVLHQPALVICLQTLHDTPHCKVAEPTASSAAERPGEARGRNLAAACSTVRA